MFASGLLSFSSSSSSDDAYQQYQHHQTLQDHKVPFFTRLRNGWNEIPRIGKIFVCTVFFEALLILIFSIIYLTTKEDLTYSGEYFAYLVLLTTFILAYFAANAVLEENPYELFTFSVVTALLTIRVSFNFHTSVLNGSVPVIVIASLAIGIFFQLTYLPLGFLVWRSFGLKALKTAGAHGSNVSRFRTYQLYLSILRIDTQFVLILGVTGLFFVSYLDATVAIIAVLMALSVVAHMIARHAVEKEKPRLHFGFMAWSLALPVYTIFKLLQMYNEPEHFFNFSRVPQDHVRGTQQTLLMTGILSLVCRLTLLIMIFLTHRNFYMGIHTIVLGRTSGGGQLSISAMDLQSVDMDTYFSKPNSTAKGNLHASNSYL